MIDSTDIRRVLMVWILAVLAGCSSPYSENDVLGAWIDTADDCASSFGWFFESGGVYSDWDGEGTWSLQGDELTINLQAKWDGSDTPDSMQGKLQPANETFSYKILTLEKDYMKLSKDNDEIFVLKKCMSAEEIESRSANTASEDLSLNHPGDSLLDSEDLNALPGSGGAVGYKNGTNDLPRIQSGTNYDTAIDILQSNQWVPVKQGNNYCLPSDERCKRYPEAIVCRGTGMASCDLIWSKNGQYMLVETHGEDDITVQNISFIENINDFYDIYRNM